MKCGRILVPALLFSAFALPSFSKDWLFVTTNWADAVGEQVLLIDTENGQIRTLWNGGAMLDAIVSPDAGRLYVTYVSAGGDELAVVEPATGAVLHRVKIPQVIRWISPSTPGMAISSDGRWLYLLKSNYSAGSSEYFLLTFDTRESRFVSGEQAVSNCPRPQLLLPMDGQVRVLCDSKAESQAADSWLVLRFPDFRNFALGRGSNIYRLYTARAAGRIEPMVFAHHDSVPAWQD